MRVRVIAVIAIFVVFVEHAWAQSSQACLDYEPARVKLSGIIISRTYPGPPNYESIREGDEPETYWLLRLSRPVCVNQEPGNLTNVAKRNIRQIQLVFNSEAAYKTYGRLLRRRVWATGMLYGSFTGHHKTPVLLKVITLEKAR